MVFIGFCASQSENDAQRTVVELFVTYYNEPWIQDFPKEVIAVDFADTIFWWCGYYQLDPWEICPSFEREMIPLEFTAGLNRNRKVRLEKAYTILKTQYNWFDKIWRVYGSVPIQGSRSRALYDYYMGLYANN